MNRTILFTGIALAVGFSVQAQTIADWTFETSLPNTAGPYSPEVGAGSIIGSHAGASVYSTPAGNGSSHSYSSTLWAVGDYYQIQVSTLEDSDIQLSWNQTSSGTGPGLFQLLYSTDGSSFTSFGSAYTVLDNGLAPNAAWNATTASPAYDFSVDLSGITALDNQPAVYIRFEDTSTTSSSGGTVGTAGTDRMDNIIVAETTVPEPSIMALFGIGSTVCLGFLRRFKK